MDWYYPVLGGAVRGQAGIELISSRWDDFVVPGLGILCVDTNPWVTGAETCELVMALDCLDDHARALRLYADMQHLRHENGSYWTGYVHPDDVFWPAEQTTYTAAAVILAADELSRTSPASGIMRGETLAAPFREIGLECGCRTGIRRDLSRRPLPPLLRSASAPASTRRCLPARTRRLRPRAATRGTAPGRRPRVARTRRG